MHLVPLAHRPTELPTWRLAGQPSLDPVAVPVTEPVVLPADEPAPLG